MLLSASGRSSHKIQSASHLLHVSALPFARLDRNTAVISILAQSDLSPTMARIFQACLDRYTAHMFASNANCEGSTPVVSCASSKSAVGQPHHISSIKCSFLLYGSNAFFSKHLHSPSRHAAAHSARISTLCRSSRDSRTWTRSYRTPRHYDHQQR